MLARAVLALFILLGGSAPLHADFCNGHTLPLCFDAGDPDLGSATDVTRYTAADDFELATSGSEVALYIEFWVMEGDFDWDGTLEYSIFEDVANPSSENGRSPDTTTLYTGNGQAITHEFTGRIGTEAPLLDFREYKYTFRTKNKVLLNSGQVYWLALHLAAGHPHDFLFWETTTIEPESYPPGTGYGSLRHYALNSNFNNWEDDGTKQQLAFKIREQFPVVPTVSPWSALIMVGILLGSGAATHRRLTR